MVRRSALLERASRTTSLVGRTRPSASLASAQQDKKTGDENTADPDTSNTADPDTSEGTVEESTLGRSPDPLQKYGIKSAAVDVGEAATAGLSVFRAFGSRCNRPDRMRENCSKTPR
jgi:hypothetical protein